MHGVSSNKRNLWEKQKTSQYWLWWASCIVQLNPSKLAIPLGRRYLHRWQPAWQPWQLGWEWRRFLGHTLLILILPTLFCNSSGRKSELWVKGNFMLWVESRALGSKHTHITDVVGINFGLYELGHVRREVVLVNDFFTFGFIGSLQKKNKENGLLLKNVGSPMITD